MSATTTRAQGLALSLVLASPLGTEARGQTTPSLVEIPIQIDLTPLLHTADAGLPREAGHWQAWRDWHGIKTRYRAWRGPLALSLSGDLLQAQTHVRYWARARKDIIGGLGLDTGCGIDEPPRQALIGMVARLAFAPDWTLRPSLKVLPPRFLDPCEVTVLGTDVAPLLGDVFTDQLEAVLSQAKGELRPRLAALQHRAARLWAGLQDPVALAPDVWLKIEPLAVALAPGRTVEIEGQALEIRGLDLGTRGGDLVLTIHVAGAAPGVLTLMARPGWDAKTSALRLTDLGFVFDAEDPDQALAVSRFYDRIRNALDHAANQLLQERSGAVRANLQATLDRVLSQADLTGVRLDLSGVALRDLRLEVGETGLRVNGAAGGQVRVRARP